MCGRYVNVASTADLSLEFDAEEVIGEPVAPSWNIAPTDPVPAVVKRRMHGADDDAPTVRQLRTLRWGLVPNWSKSRTGWAKMINARIETVTTRPAFKSAAARRRCLLPSLGYYEWQKTEQGKVPYFLHDPDGALLAMAGLYELWRDPDLPDDDPGKWLWTSTVITQPATDVLGHIHDRCPVVVPRDLQEAWLDCSVDDPQIAQTLLGRIPEVHLEPQIVSNAVNSVRNDGPELIEPVSESEVDAPGRHPVQQQLDL
ncbi:MAG: SOS response-associated peptidase [bacterium]